MKKLKHKCELIGRLLLVLVTLFTNFAGIMPVLASESYNKGDVINPVNSKGSIETDGSAKITKTVSKTDEEGIYQIDLSVQGKDKLTNQSSTAPIYVAVVLDTSGSMENEVCVKSEWKWFGFIPYRKCVEKKDIKYGEAKKAANSFANELLTKYSTSQIALVTFASDVQTTRDFESKNFDDVTYPKANGATNLGGAIKRADELLSAKKSENEDAKLYMIILSDGYPEGSQSANYNDAAKNAKEVTGVEIFSIGYDTDDDTEKLLKKIATDEDHYFNADGSTIVDKMTNIVGQMEVRVPAGTNAVLKDVIGDEFTYVEGSKTSDDIEIDGKNVTVNVRNITEEEKKYSFLVKINKDAKDGLYNTNNSCKLEYKDTNNNDSSLTLDDSAKVYWEANKYSYTVNYYKDSVSDSNFINKIEGSAVLNAEIKLSNIDVNKYKPITGYKDGSVKTSLPYIIKDGSNVINVVYEVKDDLSYTVEYYKDENKISNDSDNTFGNKYFGEKITEDQISKDKYLTFGYKNGYIKTVMPYTIVDGKNVIKVCYEKRNDMSYTVKYLEKDTNNNIGIEDKKVTGRTYNETYTEKAADAPYGYKLVSDSKKTIKVDSDDKELIFYYEKVKASYIVKYLEKDTNKEIALSEKKEDYIINPVVENAKDIEGYKLVSEDKIEIRLTDDNVNEIVFYYEKIGVNYTVKYLDNITHEEIIPSKNESGLYFDKITEKAVDIKGYKLVSLNEVSIELNDNTNEIVFFYEKRSDMSYTVKYLEKDTNNNIGIEDKKVTGRTYNETYTEKAADAPYGYKLVSDSKKTIKVDSDDKVLIFYYEKVKASYIVKYLEKDTNKEITLSEEKEDYIINPVVENAKDIEGYKLISEDKVEIRLTDDNVNEIVFYYEKISINYTVKYLDSITHEEIIPSKNESGLYFDKITEKAVDIKGYKLSSLSEVSIELNDNTNEIVFYYDKVVEVVKTGVVDNNNNYIIFMGLLSSLAVLGYSLKKRFN